MKYKIGDFLKRVRIPISIEDDVDYQLVTIKVNHRGIVQRSIKKGIEIGSKTLYKVSEGQFILSGIDARHGAFGIVPKELEGGVVTNDFWYFDYDEKIINKEYFLCLTSTPLFADVCRIASEGTTNRVRLQAKKFFDYEVWLPQVSEQHAIVEGVSRKEIEHKKLQTELKTQSNLLSKLRQAYLQEAVMGKLSEPRLSGLEDDKILDENNLDNFREEIILPSYNPKNHSSDKLTDDRIISDEKILQSYNLKNHSSDNTGKALLAQIKSQKAELIKQGKLRKEKPLPPIKPEEIPFEIPDNWVWCRLGEICDTITKGSSPKWQGVQYVDSPEKGILFITSKNVDSFKIDLSNVTYVEAEFNEIEPRSVLKKGDLLTNIVGASIGRTALYDLDFVANINQAVCILRIEHEFINKSYLLNLLNSSFVINQMFESQFAPGRANLSMGDIATFPIPLPPLSEQKAIVVELEGLLGNIGLLESENKAQQMDVQRLMGAVLQEAFGGK